MSFSNTSWMLLIVLTGLVLTPPEPQVAEAGPAAAPTCSLPSGLVVTPHKKADQYTISQNTLLCPNTIYRLPFVITASNVTLDCNGAILDGSTLGPRVETNRITGIVAKDVSNVTIARCTVRNFPGNGMNLQGNPDLPPSQLPTGIVVRDTVVENNFSNGIFIRLKDSLITRTHVAGNKLGIYFEFNTNGVTVSDSTIENSTTREGIAIDASFSNRVVGNVIQNNRNHGITVYKNCGEHASQHRREFSADNNVIENNTIRGHKRALDGKDRAIDISPGTGIAVALRQGKTLSGQQVNRTTGKAEPCSDPRSYGLPGGRHYDFANGNLIKGNSIYGNTLGVYVAGNNTQLLNNDFAIQGGNSWLDVWVGNPYLDQVKQPVTGTQLVGNLWAKNKPLSQLRQSTTGSKGLIQGTTADVLFYNSNPLVKATWLMSFLQQWKPAWFPATTTTTASVTQPVALLSPAG